MAPGYIFLKLDKSASVIITFNDLALDSIREQIVLIPQETHFSSGYDY